ncbi:hypothetical protein HNR46_000330 [Haloferula luteola]|uniref:DUF5722 domain-containing protein n=1 Tax=Haloferula luteola TaxID=595692 RepID=A0A840V8J9_9BACT|nr:DUF5722 domain-containing protein [Haloferula luteola]MBB5350109.1 hypothetical protein [Haloferula luteola]
MLRGLFGVILGALSLQGHGEEASFVAEADLLQEQHQSYPDRIDKVEVSKDEVIIEGRAGPLPAGLRLADIPLDRLLTSPDRFETTLPLTTDDHGIFRVVVPRHRWRHEMPYDRIYSSWRVVEEKGGVLTPRSHARYPEVVPCRSPDLPPALIRSKKGLGGWHRGRLDNELEELGISAVTVNLLVHSLVADGPGADSLEFPWMGRTYYLRRSTIEDYDATFQEAARHQVMVSLILLVGNPARDASPVLKILGHPQATAEGIFAMPQLTQEDAFTLYSGLLHFMAERWSRPEGTYGRVHHWIIHNEVDAGREWTNAGPLSAASYLDLYLRSLRLSDLTLRQFDPHARAFVSLTHHWANPGKPEWYGSKLLLEMLGERTAVEGDFPWALGYHPYPQNLFQPRTWEDHQATFRFSSEKVTPKNLEVLTEWMKQPAMQYRGETREIHLTENGFHSPDYSPQALRDQAAGMAFAWKKIMALPEIRMWHYHNWIDNRGEGGLRIGLRKFPDEPGAALQPKPIWYLYRDLATAREAEACEPYTPTTGPLHEASVIHTVPHEN